MKDFLRGKNVKGFNYNQLKLKYSPKSKTCRGMNRNIIISHY